jgi:hypothetical protein
VRLADSGLLPKVPPTIELCFAAGTPIATPVGEQPIEVIEVGDRSGRSMSSATYAWSAAP